MTPQRRAWRTSSRDTTGWACSRVKSSIARRSNRAAACRSRRAGAAHADGLGSGSGRENFGPARERLSRAESPDRTVMAGARGSVDLRWRAGRPAGLLFIAGSSGRRSTLGLDAVGRRARGRRSRGLYDEAGDVRPEPDVAQVFSRCQCVGVRAGVNELETPHTNQIIRISINPSRNLRMLVAPYTRWWTEMGTRRFQIELCCSKQQIVVAERIEVTEVGAVLDQPFVVGSRERLRPHSVSLIDCPST